MGRRHNDAEYMEYLRSLKKPVKKSSRRPTYHKKKAYYSSSESDSDSQSGSQSDSQSESDSDFSD